MVPPTVAAVLISLVPLSLGVNVQSLQASRVPPKGLDPARIEQLEQEWRKKHNITQKMESTKDTVKSGRSTKTVLIYQADRKDEPVCKYMYEPFVQTLKTGFEAQAGWTVTVPTTTATYSTAMATAIAALTSGDIFVFVGGVGKGTFLNVLGAANVSNATSLRRETGQQSAQGFREHANLYDFRRMQKSGVLVVYYNTDAAFTPVLTTADPVNEVWDYSKHNIDVCSGNSSCPTMRFIPPGYMSGQPQWTSQGPSGSLLHLGHAWWRTCWLNLYNQMPGELTFESSAWTDAAWTGILKHHNIFLNLNRGECGWELYPFAAARASRILSSGGILISEKVYSKDETVWGTVDGVELVKFRNFSQIATTYHNYAGMASSDFITEVTNIKNKFATAFAPNTLFTNAGIYTMMTARAR